MIRKILCFGEISWDHNFILRDLQLPPNGDNLLTEKQGPGGCALNTAAILAGIGAPVTLAGNFLGFDTHGEEIQKYLAKVGVETPLAFRDHPTTPQCQCLVDSVTGLRHFNLSHAGIQDFDEILVEGLLNEIKAGVFSHIFFQPYLIEASRHLQKYLTSDSWVMSQDLDADSEFITFIDCLQISLDQNNTFSAEEIREIAMPFFRGRMNHLLITLGSQGVWSILKNQPPIFSAATKISFLQDSTGCGDAFRAGFMFGCYRGYSTSSCLSLGQLFGAYKAQTLGSHFVQKFENIRINK